MLGGDEGARSDAGRSSSLAGAEQQVSVIISAVQRSVATTNNTSTGCGTGNGQASDQQ